MATHPLPAVAAFARVARHGSFTRAADELDVSPSALSQTVRTLEAQLGVRLLNRTTRRVALTEHGERFLQQVMPGLQQIDAAFADLDYLRGRPSGTLRINLPAVAAEHLVNPHLPGFLARYPEVRVELFVDRALADIVAGGFDAGIRLGECLARDMVAVPVGPMQRQAIVAAEDGEGLGAQRQQRLHARRVGHRLLDAHDAGVSGQLGHGLGQQVAAGAAGDVVEHHRQPALLGHRAVMGDQAGLGRTHVRRGHHQRGVRAGGGR